MYIVQRSTLVYYTLLYVAAHSKNFAQVISCQYCVLATSQYKAGEILKIIALKFFDGAGLLLIYISILPILYIFIYIYIMYKNSTYY